MKAINRIKYQSVFVLCFVALLAFSLQAADLTIETLPSVTAGHSTTAVVTADQITFDLAGFNLLILVDQSTASVSSVLPGSHLENCGWEYFTYRLYGKDTIAAYGITGGSHLLHITGLAATSSGYQPACFGGSGSLELAQLRFQVATPSRANMIECSFLPLRFFWRHCRDNILTENGSNTIHTVHSVQAPPGQPVITGTFPGLGAPAATCDSVSSATAINDVVASNGGMDVLCLDPTILVGDLNLNGIPYEVADAVLFAEYFKFGLSVAPSPLEAFIASSDVNCDGIVLSVADLVYLIRVISGDIEPCVPSSK